MKAFEVNDRPLWMVTVLCEWCLSSVGGDHPFRCCTSMSFGWFAQNDKSPPTEESNLPRKIVTDVKTCHENVNNFLEIQLRDCTHIT